MKNFLNRFGFKGVAVAVLAIMLASPSFAQSKKAPDALENADSAVETVNEVIDHSAAVPYNEIIRRHAVDENAEDVAEVIIAMPHEEVHIIEATIATPQAPVEEHEAEVVSTVNHSDATHDTAESHGGGEAHAGGLPQLDPSHWPSQIFWLLVFFSLTYFFVSRLIVPQIGSILEGRDNRISGDLEKAQSVKDEAKLVKTAYESSIAKARDDARAEVKTMQDEVAKLAAEREASFAEEAADRLSDAEKRIAAAKADAMTKVEDIAAEVSVEITNKLAGLSLASKDASGAVKNSLEAEMV